MSLMNYVLLEMTFKNIWTIAGHTVLENVL